MDQKKLSGDLFDQYVKKKSTNRLNPFLYIGSYNEYRYPQSYETTH